MRVTERMVNNDGDTHDDNPGIDYVRLAWRGGGCTARRPSREITGQLLARVFYNPIITSSFSARD